MQILNIGNYQIEINSPDSKDKKTGMFYHFVRITLFNEAGTEKEHKCFYLSKGKKFPWPDGSYVKRNNEWMARIYALPSYSILDRYMEENDRNAKQTNLEIAKTLWDELSDIPVDENDLIERKWRNFERGTSKYDIWHWFEEFFNISVACDLM